MYIGSYVLSMNDDADCEREASVFEKLVGNGSGGLGKEALSKVVKVLYKARGLQSHVNEKGRGPCWEIKLNPLQMYVYLNIIIHMHMI